MHTSVNVTNSKRDYSVEYRHMNCNGTTKLQSELIRSTYREDSFKYQGDFFRWSIKNTPKRKTSDFTHKLWWLELKDLLQNYFCILSKIHILDDCNTSSKSTGLENSLNRRSVISFVCTSLRKIRSSLMVFSSSWRAFFSSASDSCRGGGVGANDSTSKTWSFSN